MQSAAFHLGGQEIVLVAGMGHGLPTTLSLDFEAGVPFDNPLVQFRFHIAWDELLCVYLEYLRGQNIRIDRILAGRHSVVLRPPTQAVAGRQDHQGEGRP